MNNIFTGVKNIACKFKRPSYNTTKSSENVKVICPQNFELGFGSTINDFSYINAKFGIKIGENVLIGPYAILQSSNHMIKNIEIEMNGGDENSWWRKEGRRERVTGEEIIIGNDVWIGARVTILYGSVIPDKCVIGAGSIITRKNSKKLNAGDIVCNDIKLKVLGNREEYI